MKKYWRRLVLAALALMTLLGWSTYTLLMPQDSYHTLLIGGSSTVHPYIEALAQAYTKTHPDVRIYSVTGGSTPGLMAVANGAIDLATMSRDLTEDEDDSQKINHLFGRDGLGFIVHPDNPLENLSLADLEAILSGTITNWSDLTGKNGLETGMKGPIQIISSPVESNTYTIASDLLLLGEELPGSTLYAASAADVEARVAADPNAIGFLAWHEGQSSSARFLAINHVRISRETILTLRYPLTRSFYLVISLQQDTLGPDSEPKSLVAQIKHLFELDKEQIEQLRSAAILDFIDFVRSHDGQRVIESLGAIAVY